jgi:Ca2+-binding RTX toxin-like protein
LIVVGPNLPGCVIDGGAGNDRIVSYSAGNDTVSGGDGNDVIVEHFGRNLLFGNAGNDRIVGGIGADLLDGGDGIDLLAGGAGDDVLIGGEGADVMAGQAGSDLMIGGAASSEDPDAMAAVLNDWANGQGYGPRVGSMASGMTGSSTLAVAGVTFSDDFVADRIAGGAGLDWFVSDGDKMLGTLPSEVVTPL